MQQLLVTSIMFIVDNLLDDDDGVDYAGTIHPAIAAVQQRTTEEDEWSIDEEDDNASPVATGGVDHYEILV